MHAHVTPCRARHAMLLPSLVPGGCLSKLKEVELLDVGPQAPPLRGPGTTLCALHMALPVRVLS